MSVVLKLLHFGVTWRFLKTDARVRRPLPSPGILVYLVCVWLAHREFVFFLCSPVHSNVQQSLGPTGLLQNKSWSLCDWVGKVTGLEKCRKCFQLYSEPRKDDHVCKRVLGYCEMGANSNWNGRGGGAVSSNSKFFWFLCIPFYSSGIIDTNTIFNISHFLENDLTINRITAITLFSFSMQWSYSAGLVSWQ